MKLSDFNTLAEAKAHTETKGRMISPDMMVAFLATFQIGRAVEVEDSEAAFAFRKALQFGSEFNLINGHPASVLPLLNQIVAASQAFKNYVIAYANPSHQPFLGATQSQFNSARNLFSAQIITHTTGKNIAITLSADLVEKVAATVWLKESGFADENMGRSVHMQAAQRYRIDMRGKASGEYEIRVPLLDADFTVEVV